MGVAAITQTSTTKNLMEMSSNIWNTKSPMTKKKTEEVNQKNFDSLPKGSSVEENHFFFKKKDISSKPECWYDDEQKYISKKSTTQNEDQLRSPKQEALFVKGRKKYSIGQETRPKS